MDKIKKRIYPFIKIIILFLLFSGVIYTVYNNFFQEKAVIKNENIASDFGLENLNGEIVNLQNYRGKGVILNFWATYCKPCEKEMPYLEEAYKKYNDKGIEIIAVNVGEPEIIADFFVNKNNLSFPVLLDRDTNIADKYKVLTLPNTFIISENGEIVENIAGELTPKKIQESIEKILPK